MDNAESADRPAPDKGPASSDQAQGEDKVVVPYAEYEELKTLAAERDQYLKRLQRAVADYQNLQNRVTKMKDTARRDATREVAEQIVSLSDSLTRALEAAEKTRGAEDLTNGLRLVEREFYGILEGFDIRPIQAVGSQFDPHYHEAVLQEPAPGAAPNTVVREIQRGFVMGREVVRPAQVSVAAPQQKPPAQP